MPKAATEARLRDNGFGVAEIAAIIIPWIFVDLSYFEWESLQPPTDSVTADPRHPTDDSIHDDDSIGIFWAVAVNADIITMGSRQASA